MIFISDRPAEYQREPGRRGLRLLKNLSQMSFRGAAGDEESRCGRIFRTRFLAPLGMTESGHVFQQRALGDRGSRPQARRGFEFPLRLPRWPQTESTAE